MENRRKRWGIKKMIQCYREMTRKSKRKRKLRGKRVEDVGEKKRLGGTCYLSRGSLRNKFVFIILTLFLAPI